MSLNKFITQLLNIEEEQIEDLKQIIQSDNSVIFKVKLKFRPTLCPYCNGPAKIHGYYSRKLTHSTFVNRKCVIYYQQRRFRCDSCEVTFHEENPFINSGEGVTYETKINVLKGLKYPESTYTSIARNFDLSVTKVIRIFDKHVNIPRKHLPRILSIDEHYFPESDYDSLYCCLLMDFQSGEIIDILPDRRKNYLLNYFSAIKNSTLDYKTARSELNNVEYISMDLYEIFRDVARTYFPQAVICADSFHVLKHLTEAFKNVRIACRRQTEDPVLIYLLGKFRFVFNHSQDLDNEPKYNKRLGRYVNYRDIRDLLLKNFPYLEVAYNLKESYIIFNQHYSGTNATPYLDDFIKKFADSGIKEYDEFYGLLNNWRQEIINSFTFIEGKRINNSFIESKNRILGRLIFNANGFANYKRTRNRILYCLNKDDNYKI